MTKWEVCYITAPGDNTEDPDKREAYLLTTEGQKILYTDEDLSILIAKLALDGWEPMPVMSSFSYLSVDLGGSINSRWFFKRPVS